jgi:hypothetical protein
MVQKYMSGQVGGMTQGQLDEMDVGCQRWKLAVTASTGMAAV